MFIYLHWPFCVTQCIYCDFFTVLSPRNNPETKYQLYVDALKREIDCRAQFLTHPIQTLYIGGGTPSLMSPETITSILTHLSQYASWAPDAEITMEANPNAFSDSNLSNYRQAGITRISFGVQSFQSQELKALSRQHTAMDAETFYHALRQAGFQNIGFDLMYGIPHQTLDTWQATLEKALSLKPEHLSFYGLQVESGTYLERLIHKGIFTTADSDTSADMYAFAHQCLANTGYTVYEISNACRPGFESRHNLNYWNNGDFLAFGASAHGQLGALHYANASDFSDYCKHPAQSAEIQTFSWRDQVENYLMLRLRLTNGLSFPALQERYGIDLSSALLKAADPLSDKGLLSLSPEGFNLTPSGFAVSTAIITHLLHAIFADLEEKT